MILLSKVDLKKARTFRSTHCAAIQHVVAACSSARKSAPVLTKTLPLQQVSLSKTQVCVRTEATNASD